MWKNSEIKSHARCALRKNYWTLILLFFILVFIGGMNTISAKNVIYTAPSGIASSFMSYIFSEGDVYGSSMGNNIGDATNDTSRKNKNDNLDESSDAKIGLSQYLENVHDNPRIAAEIAKRTLDRFNETGGFLYSVMYQVDKFIFSHSVVAKFISIAIIVLYLPFYIFIWNALFLGYQRVLIETQTYSKTKFRRLFSMFRVKGYVNACLVLFQRTVFLVALGVIAIIPLAFLGVMSYCDISFGSYLDALVLFAALAMFVILAIIALRQYFLLLFVPFIIATEPLLKRKDVFKLSRKMMNGNIIHYIGLRISFIGWHVLEILTLGILRIFYSGSYLILTKACLYLKLRQHALDAGFDEIKKIENPYLTNPPNSSLDGIDAQSISSDKSEFKIYPIEYPDIQVSRLNKIAELVDGYEPTRHYTLLNLIVMFFIFSILGWCWEVMLHIIRDGALVNRGMLHGPWLPIYGTGGVLIILFLRKLADKPYVLFPVTMILCGVLEFTTSWCLETFHGVRWWDYSNYFLNIDGRICLEGLLTFAVGGILFVYFLGPILDNLLKEMNGKIKIVCVCVLIIVFSIDVAYSIHHPNMGAGITDYNQASQLHGTHSSTNISNSSG